MPTEIEPIITALARRLNKANRMGMLAIVGLVTVIVFSFMSLLSVRAQLRIADAANVVDVRTQAQMSAEIVAEQHTEELLVRQIISEHKRGK